MILNHEQLKMYSSEELRDDIARHTRLKQYILDDPSCDWIREWNNDFIESIKAELELRSAT